MKISVSIELVWKIASQEAITTEYEAIEPEHFFEAVLKMTEIPIFQYKQMGLSEAIILQLNNELQALCSEIHSLDIDGKSIRKKIKERLGKGNHPFQGGTLHRSGASRELFDRMAVVAADERTEVITLKHMLKALIESPTANMLEILDKKLKKKSEKKAATPLLNEYGRDLKKQSADAKSHIKSDRKAESSALINALMDTGQKSVLFICDKYETVHSIVVEAVHTMLNQKANYNLKDKRIVDISFLKVNEDDEQMARLNQIFSEMSKTQDLILFVPSFDSQAFSHGKEGWISILQTVLGKGNNRVICHTTPEIYDNFVKKDSGLKRLFHRLWISKENSKDIPHEL
jgi:ATP-dependent Clp protease ATP-binding subunit ClpC